ncbi:hypothetical protein GNP89_06710 [Aliivibrio fischeri]|nr:hypothetical protein [Aliivibrio fischeri]
MVTVMNNLPLQENNLSRIGWISEIHQGNHRLKIDFEGNPFGQPIWGSIGRAFTREEICIAIDNQLDCRINFLAGDLSLPILVDIYFSLLGQEALILNAKRIILEGNEEVTIRSGDAKTTFKARNGSVQTTASHISSSSEKQHKIQGKRITLN